MVLPAPPCKTCGVSTFACCRRIDCGNQPKRQQAFGDFAKAIATPWVPAEPLAEVLPIIPTGPIRTCLSCGGRHPINEDGSLPCGH